MRIGGEQSGDLQLIERPQQAEILDPGSQIGLRIPAEAALKVKRLAVLMIHLALRQLEGRLLGAALVGDDDPPVTAQDGGGEGEYEDAEHEAGVKKGDGGDEHARQPAHGRRKRPAHGQHASHVDAHELAGQPVLGGGPHRQPQLGVVKEPVKESHDAQAYHQDK